MGATAATAKEGGAAFVVPDTSIGMRVCRKRNRAQLYWPAQKQAECAHIANEYRRKKFLQGKKKAFKNEDLSAPSLSRAAQAVDADSD